MAGQLPGAGRERRPDPDPARLYGELLLSVQTLREQFGRLTETERRLLVFMADTAWEVSREPDHSIWEIRREPRRYVHSKLMCWVAVDRAIRLSSDLGAEDRGSKSGHGSGTR